MGRGLLSLAIVVSLASLSGCAMCGSSEDCTYAAYGGKWQRANRSSGRVASLFDPAEAEILNEEILKGESAIESGDGQQSVLAPAQKVTVDGKPAADDGDAPAMTEPAETPDADAKVDSEPAEPPAGAPATTDLLPGP